MFRPMLVYQTFADTTLSDVASKDAVARYVKRSSLYKRLEIALADKYTHQPLQHVLDEPIIQFGSGGVVVTVERHLKWIGWGMALAMAFNLFSSTKFMVKVIGGVIVSFCATIKGITWILMNWKQRTVFVQVGRQGDIVRTLEDTLYIAIIYHSLFRSTWLLFLFSSSSSSLYWYYVLRTTYYVLLDCRSQLNRRNRVQLLLSSYYYYGADEVCGPARPCHSQVASQLG